MYFSHVYDLMILPILQCSVMSFAILSVLHGFRVGLAGLARRRTSR